MEYKEAAKKCLDEGDYKNYYENSKLYHEATNTKESSEECMKSKRKYDLYLEIEELLKKNKEDYYSILGLDKNCTQKQVRESYCKLMNKYHPDRTKIKESNSVCRIIQKAYIILNDPEKRNEYDLKSNSLIYKGTPRFRFVVTNDFSDLTFDDILRTRSAYNSMRYNNINNIFFNDLENTFFNDLYGSSSFYRRLYRNMYNHRGPRRFNRLGDQEYKIQKIIIFILVLFTLFLVQ